MEYKTKLKAALADGTYCETEAVYIDEELHKSITISKHTDFSDIVSIEIPGFEYIARNDEDGYFVFPRAEGCSDYCMFILDRHKEDFEKTLTDFNMPVFGVKTDKCACLVHISGMSYDYSLRLVLKDGKYSLFPMFDINCEKPYEDPKVDIYYLQGFDANYSGMARKYREIKRESGLLIPLSEKIKKSPATEYSLYSPMIRIRCGWKPAPSEILHQTRENEPPMYAACSFERVGELLDELKSQGVDKAEICLVGWNVKGHDGRWPETFPVCDELGGEEKLRALIKKAQSMGYAITCHTNHTDQYEIADIYDEKNTRLDKNGNPVYGKEVWSGGRMSQLCPKIGYEQAKEILPKVANLGFSGTHYIDVLGICYRYRCYNPDHYVNSYDSVRYAEKLCGLARSLFGGVSSEGAYDFVAPYLDYGLYISFNNNYDGICDKSIPFWQIVYHGYVMSNPYAVTINATFKTKKEQLKIIEYGARPTYYFYSRFTGNGFDWMGKTDAVCTTDEEMKNSVKNISLGCDMWHEYDYLNTEFMENHEEISDGVYRITYSDGTIILVDYNKEEYKIEKQEAISC